jgi:hypothetical protein
MNIIKRKVITSFLSFIFLQLNAQIVFQEIADKAISCYLDEMANENIIQINSVIKPYSRIFIAEKLIEIKQAESQLNKRQKKELDFYLKDFNKELIVGKFPNKRFDLFYYSDSLFKFTLNPIIGGQFWKNENGTNYHRYFGAEAFAYAGKHLGLYASLRDNTEKIRLADTNMITIRNGGKYRGGDYSEMRGGLTWSWKWGYIALVKDHTEWGNSYRYPNIISSKAPSFAQLRWYIKPAKWFEFNYIHGWLVSEIVDSSRSYNYNGVQRNVFHNKYIAANMFTFIPWKQLNISVGNSVIYSDQYLNPAYFIPVFFYKSVDHTYNGNTSEAGQNSQMFFDISCRLVPKTHLYYSMFIDVMSFSTVFDKDKQINHWSTLGGIRISNLLPNLGVNIEYVRNRPMVYKNDDIILYASNWYNLGHYLGDNAQEFFAKIDFKPYNTLEIETWFSFAQKGTDYVYTRKPPFNAGLQFMENVDWEQQQFGLRIRLQLINDLFVFVEAEKQDVWGNYQRYNSDFYQGNTRTWSFGMNFGFY